MSDRLGLREVARLLGMNPKRALKRLNKYRWVYPPSGSPPRWDARIVDFVQAVRGKPHRPLEPAHNDWLARYQKEQHCLQQQEAEPAVDETQRS